MGKPCGLWGELTVRDECVFRIKESHNGNKWYKIRLVMIKRFQQKEGIDYIEIHSPMVKLTTIKTMFGLVAKEDLHLEQLDVRTIHKIFKNKKMGE